MRYPQRWFQTNPCGVEALERSGASDSMPSFRRTLVGLKHAYNDLGKPFTRFRRTLVGLKREVEARLMLKVVSDEPLWG